MIPTLCASLKNPTASASLGFEILARESERDSSGYAGANFYTSLNRKYEGFDYALRSDDYTLFRHQNEEDDAFDMRKGGATCAPPSSC